MISSSCGARAWLFRALLGGLGVRSLSSEQRSITFAEDELRPDLRLRLGGGRFGPSSPEESSMGGRAVERSRVDLQGRRKGTLGQPALGRTEGRGRGGGGGRHHAGVRLRHAAMSLPRLSLSPRPMRDPPDPSPFLLHALQQNKSSVLSLAATDKYIFSGSQTRDILVRALSRCPLPL